MRTHEVRPIRAAETRPLRQQLLRPNQRADQLIYPGDDLVESAHFGAFSEGRLIGIASVYPQAVPGSDEPRGWRLRGMAVTPNHRGENVGKTLFAASVSHAESQGGAIYWCNARVSARGFYLGQGMAEMGEEFELPEIGLHVVMTMLLGH